MTEVSPAPAAPLNPVSAAGTPAQLPAATAPPAAPEAPPWGDDFNPEKAWSLVQNLRADKEKLAARPVLTPEQQQRLDEFNRLEQASKTEAQRQQEAITAAERARETAEGKAIRMEVAIEYGIGKEDLDLLGSGTQDEIAARAKRIADLRAAAVPPAAPAPSPTPGQRPVEQLRPGATPTGTQSEDDANYARLFGPDAR